MPDAINADRSELCNPDVVCDITNLPFPENRFSEVFAYNVLTQVEYNADYLAALKELYRVTDGVIHIRVPYALDECAFQDPMDCRRFTPESFTYMEYEHRRYEQYGKHYGFPPFKVVPRENNGRQMLFDLYPIK